MVMVGEMRDLESISFALTIAETGHLVLATMHTNDSVQTIDRIIDVFPAERRPQIQIQLAGTLLAVIYQRLVPRSAPAGGGLRGDDRRPCGAQPDPGGQDPPAAQRGDHPPGRRDADPGGSRSTPSSGRPDRLRGGVDASLYPQDIDKPRPPGSPSAVAGRDAVAWSGRRAARRLPYKILAGVEPYPGAGWWRPATCRGSTWRPSRPLC